MSEYDDQWEFMETVLWVKESLEAHYGKCPIGISAKWFAERIDIGMSREDALEKVLPEYAALFHGAQEGNHIKH